MIVRRLRDDPQPLPLAGCVRRQDTAPIDHGNVIEAAVFLVEITPVSRQMPYEKLVGRLSGILEGIEGSRRGDDLTGVKFGFCGDSSLISTRNEVTASRFGLES